MKFLKLTFFVAAAASLASCGSLQSNQTDRGVAKVRGFSSRPASRPAAKPAPRRQQTPPPRQQAQPPRQQNGGVQANGTPRVVQQNRATNRIAPTSHTIGGRDVKVRARRQLTTRHKTRADRLLAKLRKKRRSGFDFDMTSMLILGYFTDSPLLCAVAGFNGYCFLGVLMNGDGFFDDQEFSDAADEAGIAEDALTLGLAPDNFSDRAYGMLDDCVMDSDYSSFDSIASCLENEGYVAQGVQLSGRDICTNAQYAQLREVIEDNRVGINPTDKDYIQRGCEQYRPAVQIFEGAKDNSEDTY